MRVFLIGPMSSGKTTIGRLFAEKMQLPFVDTDQAICKTLNLSVHTIFKRYGEEFFRKLEAQAIAKLSTNTKLVLATGGGCILNAQTRIILRQNGIVCYLKTSVVTQMQRLSEDNSRPTLPIPGKRYEFLTNMAKVREPMYCETADISISTDHINIACITEKLCAQIKEFCDQNYTSCM